jgi:acetyltransferase-like isoleucine patch superfamily enzyme
MEFILALSVVDEGENNTVTVPDSIRSTGTGRVVIRGNRNLIEIQATNYNFGATVEIGGDSNKLTVAPNVNCKQLFIHMAGGASLTVGRGVSFNGVVRFLLHEPSAISIGSGCLFASDIDISVSDMHSVIDLATGNRSNHARPIWIGQKVWVGQRAMILKGVSIGNGSVIAAGSIVIRDVPSNCLAAGNPARVVRENVTWDFKLL